MKCVYLSFKKENGEDKLDKTTTLAVPIQCEGYGCGLVEVGGKVVSKDINNNRENRNRENLFLCCDICEDSNVQTVKMPVIRQLHRNPNGVLTNSIENIIWLKVNRPEVTTIRMYIANSDGNLASLSSYRLNCMLLFVSAS